MNFCLFAAASLSLLLGSAHAGGLRGLLQDDPIYAIPVEVGSRQDPLLDGLLAIPANAAQNGMWSGLKDWPIVSIHSAVMPNGQIAAYGAMPGQDFQDGRTFVMWDPKKGFTDPAFNLVPNAQDVDSFCSSATLLSDGSFLVSGGAGEKIKATSRETSILDWKTNKSRRVQDMKMRRWYGTMTALPDGRALTTGGGYPYATTGWQNPPAAASVTSSTPEVYTEGVGWELLTGAYSLDAFGAENNRYWYPRQWVSPHGTIFGLSTDKMWEMTSLAGVGAIRTLGDFKTGPDNVSRPNVGPTSTAVMYDEGLILQVGGNGYANGYKSPSSAAATIFDINGINGGNVQVTEVPGMNNARQWANSVVLPDGKVVVTGGSRFADDAGSDAVLPAEIWNPATKTWTVAASMAVYRGYHSSVALLPNGALLSSGGGIPGPVTHYNAEIYYPPYLFEQQGGASVLAERPRIISISDNGLVYAQLLQVQVGTGGDVAEVSLIALPTNTHSFDSNQRRLKLGFKSIASGVQVTMPSSRNLAPPGYYYLSIVNAAGIPSNAVIVSLESVAPPLPTIIEEVPTAAPTLPPGGPVFEPIRINTGGLRHTDVNSNVWQADAYFGDNGTPFCQLQGVTMPDAHIYGCERYYNQWVHSTPYAYEIPVDTKPAQYNVVLHFAEVYFKEVNKRVFDVWVNGVEVFAKLDVVKEAGYQVAYKVVAQPVVSNGIITITLVNSIENPKISGIEVTKMTGPTVPTTAAPRSASTSAPVVSPVTSAPTLAPVTSAPTLAPVTSAPVTGSPVSSSPTASPVSTPTTAAPVTSAPVTGSPVSSSPTASPVFTPTTAAPVPAQTLAPAGSSGSNGRINLGASVPFVDEADGLVWQPDPFTTGTAQSACTIFQQFQGFQNADLFCQYREWIGTSGVLEVPVPSNGFYNTNLYFVNAGDGPGERVVDIYIEGIKVLGALDVAAEIGNPYGWYFYTYSGPISGGASSIEVRAVTGKPSLAAIQILDITGASLPTPSPVGSPTTASPVATATAAPTTPIVSAGSTRRFNLGATVPFVDETDGLVWQPDPFTTGTAQNACSIFNQFQGFQNTNLYCQYREWIGTSGALELAVPSDGFYRTILYFVNAGDGPGERVVDLYVEGNPVGASIDVSALIGWGFGTYTFTVAGFISGGSTSIELRGVTGNPTLAAIEVVAD